MMISVVTELTQSLTLCLFVHTIWGLQPAAARYLLVFSATEFNSQSVIAFSRLISIFLMLIKDSTFPPEEISPPTLQPNKSQNSSSSRFPLPGDLTKYYRTLLIFGLLSALRSMTNILSCGLTSAYNVAIVNLLSPLLTPMADKYFLGAEIPGCTWTAVGWTTVGCGAMIYGEYENGDNSSGGVTSLVGVLVQVVSVVFSVAIRMMMKTTQGTVTKSELMHSANAVTVGLGFAVGYWMVGWSSFTTILTTLGRPLTLSFFWLMFLGAGVYTVGSYLQIVCCRIIGPGLYASFSSVRVAVAVVSSSWILGEDVEGWWVWGGLCTVAVSVTWYTREILKWGEKKKEQIVDERVNKGTFGASTTFEADDGTIDSLEGAGSIVTVENLVYEKVGLGGINNWEVYSGVRGSSKWAGEQYNDDNRNLHQRNIIF